MKSERLIDDIHSPLTAVLKVVLSLLAITLVAFGKSDVAIFILCLNSVLGVGVDAYIACAVIDLEEKE